MIKRAFTAIAVMLALLTILFTTACGSEEQSTNELNVYMLNPDDSVKSLVSSYKGENGTMSVNVEVGVTSPEMEAGDAVKLLNTRLMSDDGPDIILLDGINPENYIGSGQLEDLSKIAEDNSQIILPLGDKDDKIYYIPVSFAIMEELSSSGADADFSDIERYVQSLKADNLKSGYINDNAIICYKKEIEPEIIKNNGISEEDLRAFYENIKELKDVTFWDEEFVKNSLCKLSLDPGNMMIDGSTEYTEICNGTISATRGYVTQIDALQTISSMEDEGILKAQTIKIDDEYSYIPTCVLAVNANSKHKKEAMEMIEYLLSEESQQDMVDHSGFLPVNRKVLKKSLEESEESDGYYNGLHYVSKPFSEEKINEIMLMTDNFKYECNSDSFLMEIIMLPAQRYANDEISLDDAVDQAMSKLKIYLAE